MKVAEKEAARELRRQGESIRDIAARLNVSKGTVSVWVRDIQLTDEQVEVLNRRLARNRERFAYLSRCGGANQNRLLAEQRQAAFRKTGYELARVDEQFRLVCALYWGEGTKNTPNVFAVTNCDPALLQFVLRWLLRAGYGNRLRFTVYYHEANGLTEDEILAWWLNELPRLQPAHVCSLLKCKINRASQLKRVGRQPYGTATIRVCCTELLQTVLGGIASLQEMGDW